jgi:hypothetical protein
MRLVVGCVVVAVSTFPLAAVAGESLVNGSFEDGTYNGWVIATNNGAVYNDPPPTSDQTGRSDQPLSQNLVAADGQHFAGLCHAGGVEPDPAGGYARFRQVIDVSSYNPNADRTNYDLQLWALLAATQDHFTDGNVSQAYTIYWQDVGDELHDFYDTLIVSAQPTDGDTLTIDTTGVVQTRVYEFDNGGGVTSGHVPVTIGGTRGATTTNLVNAITNDGLSPCTALKWATNTRVLLSWKTTASANNAHIAASNSGSIDVTDNNGNFKPGAAWNAGFDHEYHLGSDDGNFGGGGGGGGAGFFNDQAFAQYGKANGSDQATPLWNKWRKVHLTGSIPGKPTQLILEITLVSNGDVTQYNCFDGVSFSAASAIGSSLLGTFTGDINNGDFEMEPFDQIYSLQITGGNPAGWGWGSPDPNWIPTDPPSTAPDAVYMKGFDYDPAHPSQYNGGPLETYTNGDTTPTNAMGINAPSGEGTHYLGRNHPAAVNGSSDLDGYWGKVLPVHNWSECASGFKWKIHYYTKMYAQNDSSYQWLEFCWDAGGTYGPQSGETGLFASVLDYPDNILIADMLDNNWFSYIRPLNLYKARTPGNNLDSTWDEIEQTGEFSPVGGDGNFFCPQYILVRHRDHATSVAGTQAFSQLYDKIDISVEATYTGTLPLICSTSPLPNGDCTADYSQQLRGGGVGNVTWSLVSGALPPGLTLSSSGLISGHALTGGTFTFTVKLHDESPPPSGADTTKELQITIDLAGCCNLPKADLDGDHDVDQVDFALFQACISGTGGGVPTGCACQDLNADGLSVDQADLAVFEGCASGAGVPASPSCQ